MKRIVLVALTLAAYLPLVPMAQAQHVTSGIIAEYDFEEGTGTTVSDVSGFGAALDLTIQDAAKVTWGAGYLSVDTSTVIESLAPATKINDAVALGGSASNEITIEAFVKPTNNFQGGAARIVNIGTVNDPSFGTGGPTHRNVFLAQDATNYDARLRTTGGLTGNPPVAHPNLNGDKPQQQTDGNNPIAASPELQHVVFTRDAAGNSFIYVNGAVLSDPATTQPGDLSNWDAGYGLTLANEQAWNPTQEGVRDFLGEFHHVTIYDRALSLSEVQQNAVFFGVPEPTSLVMVFLGIGLFGAKRRRSIA